MGMSDQYDDGRYDPVFGHGFHITAVRGGIKYPTPIKETHMPEPRMTKSQIANELRLNAELQETLRKRRVQLQKQARQAIPAEPQDPFVMFSVSVKFKMHGPSYHFLILKSGGHYWTTGTKKDQQVFSSWETLCEWLEGPEVYSHSDLVILKSAGKVVSFTSGAIERVDPSDLKPPF